MCLNHNLITEGELDTEDFRCVNRNLWCCASCTCWLDVGTNSRDAVHICSSVVPFQERQTPCANVVTFTSLVTRAM